MATFYSTHEVQKICLGLAISLNINTLIWGMPGAGKTSVLNAICNAYGLHMEELLISTMDASDVGGTRYVYDGEEKQSTPEWVQNILEAYKPSDGSRRRVSVAFWDEFSNGMRSVQAAALTPIIDRKAGRTQMPKSTRMIAAANPPGMSPNGWDLTPPTANRFTHLNWTPDADAIADGFQNGWSAPPIPTVLEKESLNNAIHKSQILVGSYIRKNPESIVFDQTAYDRRGKNFNAVDYAFPSARSWHFASIIYAGATTGRMSDTKEPIPDAVLAMMLEGTVGVKQAQSFLKYVASFNLPDPVEVLNNPQSFEIPNTNDRLTAFMASLQLEAQINLKSLVKAQNPQAEQLWKNWGDALCRIVDNGSGDIAWQYIKRWQESIPPGAGLSSNHEQSLKTILSSFSEVNA